MKLTKFMSWGGNPERSHNLLVKSRDKNFMLIPSWKILGSLDFAKFRPGNPRIENSWSRWSLLRIWRRWLLGVIVKVTKYDNYGKNNRYDKNDKNAFSAWSSGSPKASFCCPHMASVIESAVSMPEQLESDSGSLLEAALFCPILFYFVFDCPILSLSMIKSTDAWAVEIRLFLNFSLFFLCLCASPGTLLNEL